MSEGIQLLKNIWDDMQEPVGYLPRGLLIGLAALPFLLLWEKSSGRGRNGSRLRTAARFLGIVYAVVVWNTVFLGREPGSRTGMDLRLFGTWGADVVSRGYVIENVILFLPFGILFPCAVPPLRKGWRCILAALLISIGIEALQLATGRGYCQLDDVVMNTLGAGAGWLAYRATLGWHGRSGRMYR